MNVLLRFALVLFVFSSCTATRNAGKKEDGKIEINFIQINDVYEIAPLAGGKEGGMARVATIKKKYLQHNPNTYLVMAGDFVSPSVYNSLQHEGKAIRGKQMIEAMNAAGMDFAAFGNHEFDIRENELQERIDESRFLWVSSNVFHQTDSGVFAFKQNNRPVPGSYILEANDQDGTKARVGLFALCMPFNKAEYVSYADALATAKSMYQQLKDSVDAVVAITHQSIREDEKLARELPGLAAILGGHEHDQRFSKIGNTTISKAMANAKSAYVINLRINKRKRTVDVTPTVEVVNEKVSSDSTTHAVIQKWQNIAEKNFGSIGFDARRMLISSGESLDGRETETRTRPTNLTKLIVSSMAAAVPAAQVVVMNAGSIRVDDELVPPVTEYDIIRTLPFGGSIREVDMKGSLLIRTLEAGRKNIGTGGYLHYNEQLIHVQDKWMLNHSPIDSSKVYHVAITDFLLTGREANLDFLNPTNADMVKVYDAATSVSDPKSDIRLAVIKYLEGRK